MNASPDSDRAGPAAKSVRIGVGRVHHPDEQPLPQTAVGLRAPPLRRILLRILFAALCCAAVPIMLLKQFQGLEGALGLNDKAAHALAFYAACIALFVVAPRARRWDLCLIVLATAVTVELLQQYTGRSPSLGDFFAGAAGVAAAWASGKIEEIRRKHRGLPDRREGAPDAAAASASPPKIEVVGR